jgi:hypothetical protein
MSKTVTLESLANELRHAAEEHRQSRPDDELRGRLSATLADTQTATRAVETSAHAARAVIRDAPAAVTAARAALSEARRHLPADAISFAKSPEHNALVRHLTEAATALQFASTAHWEEERKALAGRIPEAFVSAALNVPSLRAEARQIQTAHVLLRRLLRSGQIPSSEEIEEARRARATIDRALSTLEARVPVAIREPLQRAAAGELRLHEVTDEFQEWLRENKMQDAVRVTLR